MWFDDPIFDEEKEQFGGRVFEGQEWRKLQHFKEQGMKQLVSVAGTTYKCDGVKKAMVAKEKEACLIPEPDNPYDKQAVKVVVSGCEVGYVPRSKRLPTNSRVSVFQIGVEPKPHVLLAVA